MEPEKSMFLVWKALHLSCPNGDKDCVFCDSFAFCEALKKVKDVMVYKYPKFCEKFDLMLRKEGDD